jgi:hypothetical protein
VIWHSFLWVSFVLSTGIIGKGDFFGFGSLNDCTVATNLPGSVELSLNVSCLKFHTNVLGG